MTFRVTGVASALIVGCAVMLGTAPVSALGLKDCSDAYSAAKAAGKAGTKTFAEFQKSDCGPDAKPVAAPAAAAAPAAVAPAKPAPAAKAATAPAATPAPAAAPAATTPPATAPIAKSAKITSKPKTEKPVVAAPTVPVTGPVFPTAMSASAKGKKPSKARLATCVEQYRANKATNANGGLKWIQKSGGYWSQCNKKMKEIKAA
jgi:hypothetical protein